MAFIQDIMTRGVFRATFYDNTTHKIIWQLPFNMKSPVLKFTTATSEVKDAYDVTVREFINGRSAEFTAEYPFKNLALLAQQNGATLTQAAVGSTINANIVDDNLTVPTSGYTVTLSQIPVGTSAAEIPVIYTVNTDGSIKDEYTVAASAAENKFAINAASKTITLPTNATAGDKLWIPYKYAASSGIYLGIYNNTQNKVGRLVLESFAYDKCNPNVEKVLFTTFNNAQLTGDSEFNYDADSTQSFTIRCMPDYCTTDHLLCTMTMA